MNENSDRKFLIKLIVDATNNNSIELKKMLDKLTEKELYLIIDLIKYEDKEENVTNIPEKVKKSSIFITSENKAYSISNYINILTKNGLTNEDALQIVNKLIDHGHLF